MLKKAFGNVQNRDMKSESGFSFAMASQLLQINILGQFEWLPSTIFTAATEYCPQPFLLQTFYQLIINLEFLQMWFNQLDECIKNNYCIIIYILVDIIEEKRKLIFYCILPSESISFHSYPT